MAIDEALLRDVREPVLRIYEWSVPAVSLGYFQPHALAGDRPFIRRYTGGGLVDHAHDVTYTVVLPRAHEWMELSAPESYCHIHRGVQAALAACGVVSELTPAAQAVESEACFQKAGTLRYRRHRPKTQRRRPAPHPRGAAPSGKHSAARSGAKWRSAGPFCGGFRRAIGVGHQPRRTHRSRIGARRRSWNAIGTPPMLGIGRDKFRLKISEKYLAK